MLFNSSVSQWVKSRFTVRCSCFCDLNVTYSNPPCFAKEPKRARIFNRKIMAGGGEDANLTGMSKYFNSQTMMGRANVAKATYAAMALIGLYVYLKPSKK